MRQSDRTLHACIRGGTAYTRGGGPATLTQLTQGDAPPSDPGTFVIYVIQIFSRSINTHMGDTGRPTAAI